MKYEKPYKGDLHIGCLNCSTASRKLHMDRVLGVGFGDVIATKDGKRVYSETQFMQGKHDVPFNQLDMPTVQTIEDMATKNPEQDWRIKFDTALHGETYQRQKGKWVLIDSNPGFA